MWSKPMISERSRICSSPVRKFTETFESNGAILFSAVDDVDANFS